MSRSASTSSGSALAADLLEEPAVDYARLTTILAREIDEPFDEDSTTHHELDARGSALESQDSTRLDDDGVELDEPQRRRRHGQDRKSTRLNSSHSQISYA